MHNERGRLQRPACRFRCRARAGHGCRWHRYRRGGADRGVFSMTTVLAPSVAAETAAIMPQWPAPQMRISVSTVSTMSASPISGSTPGQVNPASSAEAMEAAGTAAAAAATTLELAMKLLRSMFMMEPPQRRADIKNVNGRNGGQGTRLASTRRFVFASHTLAGCFSFVN